MLLAMDAGNTNITIGAFEGSTLTTSWRLRTIREQTAASMDLAKVDGTIIAGGVRPCS